MKKLSCLVMAMFMLFSSTAAEELPAMSTTDLVALRDAADRELAARVGTDAAQVIEVEGVLFRFLYAEVGEARDDGRGLGFVLLASNPTEASMSPVFDLGVSVTLDGVPLEVSWVKSKHFTSSSVSTSQTSLIAPGAVGHQVFLGYRFTGEGTRVEVVLSNKRASYRDDPYCGTFAFDLPAASTF